MNISIYFIYFTKKSNLMLRKSNRIIIINNAKAYKLLIKLLIFYTWTLNYVLHVNADINFAYFFLHFCRIYEKKKKQLDRLKEQLTKLEVQATDREENKEIALSTSKLNYLDPRISVAW
jgi:hypothetical protein